MQAQAWEPSLASKNHTSWAAAYSANVRNHLGLATCPFLMVGGQSLMPDLDGEGMGGDHLVHLPCFTDEETEAKRRKATCP